MTTHHIEITDEQIEQLAAEAYAHGDAKQLALCHLALNGEAPARAECERVIRDAMAQC